MFWIISIPLLFIFGFNSMISAPIMLAIHLTGRIFNAFISVFFYLAIGTIAFAVGIFFYQAGIVYFSIALLASFLFYHFLINKKGGFYSYKEIGVAIIIGFATLAFNAYRIFYYGLLCAGIPFTLYLLAAYFQLIPGKSGNLDWLLVTNIAIGLIGGVYFGVFLIRSNRINYYKNDDYV